MLEEAENIFNTNMVIGHLKHEEEHRGSKLLLLAIGRGNFEAPVAKDIGALLLRQPADRLAVGETLHNKR